MTADNVANDIRIFHLFAPPINKTKAQIAEITVSVSRNFRSFMARLARTYQTAKTESECEMHGANDNPCGSLLRTRKPVQKRDGEPVQLKRAMPQNFR